MTRSKRAHTARRKVNASAPEAVANHFYPLLSMQDVLDTAKLFVNELPVPHVLDEDIAYLNEVVSDFLAQAEPIAVGRESRLRRYDWFADVEATAHHMRRLLEPFDNSALLLSGLGQPMLFLTSLPRKRMTLSEWKNAISIVSTTLEGIEASAGAGRETLERDIFETRTDIDGWPIVSDTRPRGRPIDVEWSHLAKDCFQLWRHIFGKKPTVTVDPYAEPPSRKSIAARFIAGLLDLVATRLPSEKLWAAARFRGRETQLTEYLEAQRRLTGGNGETHQLGEIFPVYTSSSKSGIVAPGSAYSFENG